MKLAGKSIWVLSGFLISGFCLWLFFRNIEWEEVKTAIQGAKYFYVLPCLAWFFLAYLFRTLRWMSLISGIKKISFLNVFSATFIGFMGNHILPARAGEIVKTVILGKKEGIRVATVLGTVVMERLLDTITLIIMATVVLALLPSTQEELASSLGQQGLLEIQEYNLLMHLRSYVKILAAVCVISVIFFIFLDFYYKKMLEIIGNLLFFLPQGPRGKVMRVLESFVGGLKVLKSVRQVMWLTLLSFGIWFVFVFATYTLGHSFDIDIPITGMCLLVICTAVAVALPQAPAYIGVYHLAVLKSLELFHIDRSIAQSFAIILWMLNVTVPLVVGSFFLWREGIYFSQIVKQADVSSETTGEYL